MSSTPPEWLSSHAKKEIEKALIKGDISGLFETLSEGSKQTCTFEQFARVIAINIQMYGQFEKVGEPYNTRVDPNDPHFWMITVPLYIKNVEFSVLISYNELKQVGTMQITRKLEYHPPEYIKSQNIVSVMLSENPLIQLDSCKSPDVPTLIMFHPLLQLGIDLRMGYCFPFRDYLYMPSRGINIIRGQASEQVFNTPNPLLSQATKLVEAALQYPRTSDVYFLFQGFGSLFMLQTIKKFPGIASGIVLVNPAIDADPDSGLQSLDLNSIPKDIPILIVSGVFDQYLPPAIYQKWKDYSSTVSNITIKQFEGCDHFLLECTKPPTKEYSIFERHIPQAPLKFISDWILKQH